MFLGVEDYKQINAGVVWVIEAHNPYIKEKYWEYYAEYPGNAKIDKLRRMAKIIQLNYRYRKYTEKDEEIIE